MSGEYGEWWWWGWCVGEDGMVERLVTSGACVGGACAVADS